MNPSVKTTATRRCAPRGRRYGFATHGRQRLRSGQVDAADVHEIGRRRSGQVNGEMAVDEHQRRVGHQRLGVRRVAAEVLAPEGRRPTVRPLVHQVRVHVIVCVGHPLRETAGHGERRVVRGHVRGVHVAAQRVMIPRVHVTGNDHDLRHIQTVRHVRVARRGQQFRDEQVKPVGESEHESEYRIDCPNVKGRIKFFFFFLKQHRNDLFRRGSRYVVREKNRAVFYTVYPNELVLYEKNFDL